MVKPNEINSVNVNFELSLYLFVTIIFICQGPSCLCFLLIQMVQIGMFDSLAGILFAIEVFAVFCPGSKAWICRNYNGLVSFYTEVN